MNSGVMIGACCLLFFGIMLDGIATNNGWKIVFACFLTVYLFIKYYF